jgi:hypothetical protein
VNNDLGSVENYEYVRSGGHGSSQSQLETGLSQVMILSIPSRRERTFSGHDPSERENLSRPMIYRNKILEDI